MTLQRLHARIQAITELSPTAREVELMLSQPLNFLPGAFVNVFLTDGTTKMRRAYSISSDARTQDRISLSIRKGSAGGMSERFWDTDIFKQPIEIVGPLGLNTINTITRSRVFLFGFGIGVSVVKGLAEALLARADTTELTVVTGSRTEEEVLYKEYFETLKKNDARVRLRFVVSKPQNAAYPWPGHIQDQISDFDFTDATAYICGTKRACDSLKERITREARTVEFRIEAFD